ncbi:MULTISPECIES: carotenoid oxygenase family protein [unclassified Acinetobacter]|uniref:carotenoid oxygenase family protein n=2 Tax=Acinetobacter TaxID=469 RepID=UPI001C228B45|nr:MULTISPECIES: carotenoid oxygenase family protein [unclassified Acinetobacter]
MQWPKLLNSMLKNTLSKSIQYGTEILHQRIPYSHDNPYLEGMFAPQRQEHFFTDLRVEGQIPAELDGALMRIGPNPITVKNPRNYHWFTGDGMLHALRLKGGKAHWYKSSYIGSASVQKKLHRPQIPGKSRGVADAVNTNVIHFAGKIWALVEAGAYPVELNAALESKRHHLFENDQDLPFTAHPHIDPETGDIHAVCYDALTQNKVFYLQIDSEGKLKHQVEIPVKHGPMIHDCAITKSQVLILDLNVKFSVRSLLKGSMLPYQWNPKRQARIGVLPFGGKVADIRWYEIDPCFIFHTVNAYDLNTGDVVMDAVIHSKALVNSIQGPIEAQDIRLERFIFEQAAGKVTRTVLSGMKQEFPRINDAYTGRPYRYVYSISFGEFDDPVHISSNRLLSHDLETGSSESYSFGANWVAGEVIFIAREGSQAENEGWLMSYIHALDGSPSRVVILDAQHMTEGPIATIHLPVRVPVGFHCNWIDYRELKTHYS